VHSYSRLIRNARGAPVAAGFVALILGACSLNVTHERDASILIPAGATVAFGGASSEGRENLDPDVGNDTVHRRVQRSIAAQLEAKGYRVVDDPGRADFLVRYFVAMQRDPRPAAANPGSSRVPAQQGTGWGWGWGGGSVTRITPLDFADTSISVYLVERATDRAAWHGLWRGDVGARAPTQEEIDLKVSRIFQSAPAAR
jgi:hypothetical protein